MSRSYESDPTEKIWAYTENFRDVNRSDTYQGRRIIGRDSPIDNGVYYGTYSGEAIVVDSEKYPKVYDEWYELATEEAIDDTGQVNKNFALLAAYNTVLEQMPYSQDGVDNLLQTLTHHTPNKPFRDGSKVGLQVFMEEHVGVCRHQALAMAVLIEKFQNDGVLSGHVSVDRSQQSPSGFAQGHAWVRYTNSAGQVYIFDVASETYGTLQEVNAASQWDYGRPEDHRRSELAGLALHPMSQ